jgi:nucleotide-binding universal stress UspA family protein
VSSAAADGPRLVLVGVDGSATSMRAAAYAAGVARRQHARLVAVYVDRPVLLWAEQLPDGGASEIEAREQVASELRAEITAATARLGIDAEFVVRRGDPFTEIVRLADDLRADAVLVGSSMKGAHRLVGSLAVRLVRTGRWPVTVVP